MITIKIAPREDDRYDMHVGDEGDQFVNSSQGYERAEDAVAIARRLFSESEKLAKVRKLHSPEELDCKSCPVECEEHEDDRDCTDVKVSICSYCHERAQAAAGGYYGEEGIEEHIIYPCPTILLLDSNTESVVMQVTFRDGKTHTERLR